MDLDGFWALLFVPHAPEILNISRLKNNDSSLPFAPHSPIRVFTQCYLKSSLL